MKLLIVEDDFISRKLLLKMLNELGECDVAADGIEAVAAVKHAYADNLPYDAIFLDIMMPNLDGQNALKQIREIELNLGKDVGYGSKIIMTTALDDSKNVLSAFRHHCDAYITKPITRDKVFRQLAELGLVEIKEDIDEDLV